MEVIKKLGNNAAIRGDHSGRGLITIRLGTGFPKYPYILNDLNKTDCAFYSVDAEYLSLLEGTDLKIFRTSADVIGLAVAMLSVPLKQNVVFTLADHLNFALVRLKNGMISTTPIANELRDLCPAEVKIAKYMLNLLRKNLSVQLPESEVYAIAISIINFRETYTRSNQISFIAGFIQEIVRITEGQMKISIDTNSFNCSRFASHMQHLFRRKSQYSEINSINKKLFKVLKKEYPNTFACVLLIKEMVFHKFSWSIEDEESLYLILHVDRLCSHEDVTGESA